MDFTLSDNDRIQLDRMLQENHVEDTTEKIRELKHSKKIEECVRLIERMKREYPRIYKSNYTQFEQMVQSRGGSWLWTYYTNIYNKLMKGQLDTSILFTMIDVLRKIENCEIGQHEGSVAVGKLLKKIYIDGTIETTRNTKKTKKSKKPKNTLSWMEYKERYLQESEANKTPDIHSNGVSKNGKN